MRRLFGTTSYNHRIVKFKGYFGHDTLILKSNDKNELNAKYILNTI